jgi:hypothetical protein
MLTLKHGGRKVVEMMKSALAISALLLVTQAVSAADSAPQFDVVGICRPAATATGSTSRDAAACQRDEELAQRTLTQQWSQFNSDQKSHCVRLSSLGGSPSYVELLTCLEMAKRVGETPAK